MQLTRMFCGPWSMAMARVMLTPLPSKPQYETAFRPPLTPQPDPVLTIEPPPCLTISGTAYLLIKNMDLTFTSITLSHSSSVVPITSARRMMPRY